MTEKNKKLKWLSGVLAFSILLNVALGVGIYVGRNNYQAAQIAVENNYQRNFLALNDDMEQIKLQLAQVLLTYGDEQMILGLSNLWRAVYGALGSLNSLPLEMEELAKTGSFLRDTAEYSYYLLRKQAAAGSMSSEQWDKLAEFYQRAEAIQTELDKIQAKVLNENWHFSDQTDAENAAIQTAMRGIEEKIAAFPLIELEEGVPKIESKIKPISGKAIEPASATKLAEEFAETFFDGKYRAKLEYTVDNNPLAVYGVRLDSDNKEPIYIEVSQHGGHILQMYRTPFNGKNEISAAEGEHIAESFLAELGYRDLALAERIIYDNSCDLTYVPLENGVYLYADMLKVMVSLTHGEILSFDQSGYIANHYERKLAAPKLKKADIARKMNPNFYIDELRLALINDEYLDGEFLCYEVRGKIKDEQFAVFVDADSGAERRIVRLSKDKEYEFAAGE